MADVYLAEQTSLGRPVAVKVLRADTFGQPAAIERFEQEARAAAALVHGNIVQVHEVACIEGVHLLAEEYVAGPSLRQWLATRGPLDAAQACSVLAQVGSALSRAADHGVVHRDLKPENLLVTPAGEVKVADFGLARVQSTDLALTQEGMALGTPLYMSPEQAEGRLVDSRSDLYSLGASVYHLLAGRPAFAGPSAVAVVMSHIRDPLVPLGAVRPDLPAGLCSVVERLLAKRPEDRFATPQAMLEAVAGLETALPPGSRHGPLPLAWEGDPGQWAVAVSAALDATWRGKAEGMPQDRFVEVTRRLQAAADADRSRREASRRMWLVTLAAAAGALVLGFAIGRNRTRRSQLFGPRR